MRFLIAGMVVFLLVPLGAFSQPISSEPTEEGSGQLMPSTDILAEVMDLAAASGLDCPVCKFRGAVGRNQPDGLTLFMTGFGMESLNTFYTQLQKKRPCTISRLSVKIIYRPEFPNGALDFSLDLAFQASAGGKFLSLADLMSPLGDLAFYLPSASQSASLPALWSYEYDGKTGSRFQVVANTLEDLKPMMARSGMPLHTRTISLNTFASREFLCVDFSNDADLPLSTDAMTRFGSLSGSSRIREMSQTSELLGAKSFKLQMVMEAAETEKSLQQLCQSLGWTLKKLEVVPSFSGKWVMTGLFKPEPDQKKPSLDTLQTALITAWPPEIRDNLRFLWGPDRVSFAAAFPADAEVPDQGALAKCREIAATLGFFPEKNLSSENRSGTGQPLVLQFFRTNGGTEAGRENPMPGPLKEALQGGEILEKSLVANGEKLVVRLPFSGVAGLINALVPRNGLNILDIAVSCRHPEPAQVSFTVSSEPRPSSEARQKLASALAGGGLPWNRPDEALKDGVIMQEFHLLEDGYFEVTGVTLKSGLIFSSLFPALKKLPMEGDPFFMEGKYSDHALGRLMKFKVNGKGENIH